MKVKTTQTSTEGNEGCLETAARDAVWKDSKAQTLERAAKEMAGLMMPGSSSRAKRL